MNNVMNNELFELTEPLNRIGQVPKSITPTNEATGQSPYVRLVFTGQPQVFRRGGRQRQERDMITAMLEDGLRRARRMRLDAVLPRALITPYDVIGIRYENVAPAAVLGGAELVLGTDLPDEFTFAGEADADVDAAARLLELYEFGHRGIREPGRGLSGQARIGGEWRLAWRTAQSSPKGVVVEVAIRVELRDGLLSGRGAYLIGGRHSLPGYRGLRRAENSVVVSVTPKGASFDGATVVFWLGRQALDPVIESLHRHVALEAIRGRRSGYDQR